MPPYEVIPLTKRTMTYACGHERVANYVLRFDWELLQLNEGDFPKPTDPCPECVLAKMRWDAIPCCRCGKPIRVGAGIVLYKEDLGFRPDHVRFWNKKWIGCARSRCCGSAYQTGVTWTKDGVFSSYDEDQPPEPPTS